MSLAAKYDTSTAPLSAQVTRRSVLEIGVATAASLPFASGAARSQAWPERPIKIICAFPAGGLTDLFARTYGEHLAQRLGQPVVVENKPGAGGIVGAMATKSAPADGTTLMFTISTSILGNRVLYKSLPYDPDKDFELISYMPSGALPLVAGKASGVSNLKEFVALARRSRVNVGSYASGSFAHIAIAELNRHFDLEMEAVHYRGEAPMWQDLAAGGLQAAIGSIPAATAVLRSGAGRAIAIPHTRRMSRLPDVPTFLEQGVASKAFQLTSYICAVGPAGIPQPITERLSALMVEAGKGPQVQKLLETFGIDESAHGGEAFKRIYAEEGPIWIDLIRSLGLTPE